MCVSYCGHFKIRVGTVPLEIIATLNAVFPQRFDAVLRQIGCGTTAKGTCHGCGRHTLICCGPVDAVLFQKTFVSIVLH